LITCPKFIFYNLKTSQPLALIAELKAPRVCVVELHLYFVTFFVAMNVLSKQHPIVSLIISTNFL
jgi:hypothetical protein